MPDRSKERSPLEYALLRGDTGVQLWPWQRVWKTSLLRKRWARVSREVPHVVHIVARQPGDTSTLERLTPDDLTRPGSPYRWEVGFPRRSGHRRGFTPTR